MERKTQEQCGFLIQAAYVAVIAGLLYLGVKYLLAWLFPFVAGYFIAMAVRPISVYISGRFSVSQRAAGSLVLPGVYFLLVLLFALLGVFLADFVRQAVTELPGVYRRLLRPAMETLEALLKGWAGRIAPGAAAHISLETFSGGIQGWLLNFSADAIGGLGAVTAKLPGYLMTFLFTIASSLLISSRYQEIASFLARQAPVPIRRVLFSIKKGTGKAVFGYCKAYALLLCVTFLQLAAGLRLLGIKDAVTIAAFATILDLLPVLGVGTLLLPWALIMLLQGNHPMAAGLVLLYAIVLTVHNILEPRLIGKQLGLHPLVSICAVYLGYRTLGIGGMILAPIVAQLVIGLHQTGALRLWK